MQPLEVTLAQVFSFEFCEIFKNTFFTEHLQATAPERCVDFLLLCFFSDIDEADEA